MARASSRGFSQSIFTMSSISNAGIFIDIKQLLKFTHVMKKEMSAADKEDYGHMLTQYNLDMIKYFTMA